MSLSSEQYNISEQSYFESVGNKIELCVVATNGRIPILLKRLTVRGMSRRVVLSVQYG